MSATGLDLAVRRMRAAGQPDAAVRAFTRAYGVTLSGDLGLVPEAEIEPVRSLPTAAELPAVAGAGALARTALVKLNGGLGTSMGMDRAKSLLAVRGARSFLDLTATQVQALRAELGIRLPLILMNSYRTARDSLQALSGYPDLPVPGLPLDFPQSREPRLWVEDLTPVDWPADPELEWCPPGHGDIYPALAAAGLPDLLLEQGFRYLFVSNSDNLGARPDPAIAEWFAGTGAPFAAEFCRRTAADRKGGHLARRRATGRLLIRESAQTSPQDHQAFGDLDRHPYFNTNNLWLDLVALRDELTAGGGVLDLPVIRNVKTIDPADPGSPEVVQLESAMGAAIGVFDGSVAIEVDRSRFLPVKTTDDLLVLRSDAYLDDPDGGIRQSRPGAAPLVSLDPVYRMVAGLDRRFPQGPPSLVDCHRLEVFGDWTFGGGVVARGSVAVGPDGSPGRIPDGALLVGSA